MKKELIKELQKRLEGLVDQVILETNQYYRNYLRGEIEALEGIMNWIEQLEDK